MSNPKELQELQDGTSRKTLTAYLLGYILSLVLLVIAFLLVQKQLLGAEGLYVSLSCIAVFLLLVQVAFFLRLNSSVEGRWNLMTFLFTILIIVIVMTGSLWIMYNLNYNMVH